MLRISRYGFVIAALGLLPLLSGCHGYSVTGGPGKTVAAPLTSSAEQPEELLHVNTVFLMPVIYSAEFLRNAASAGSADADLVAAWRRQSGLELVTAGEALSESRSRTGLKSRGASAIDWWGLAHARGCDSLLQTEVNELTERVGSGMGAERPASATVSFRLLKLDGRSPVWSAMYTAKDQAVSENLFRLGEKLRDADALKWHSAKELLEAGFEAAAKDLAARRNASFMSAAARGGSPVPGRRAPAR